MHAFFPRQLPVQPENTKPGEAVARSRMFDAALKLAEHRFGHVRPAGELDTLPLPPTPTVRRNRPAPNVAVTLRAASSVTAHGAVPGQAPVQPAKREPVAGRAMSHRQAQIELDIAVLRALEEDR